MADFDRVLHFWFGELDRAGTASDAVRRRWWMKDPQFDDEIRTRFCDDYEAIVAGEREDWLDTAPGTLAYVIVLDQFARNMFRDTPRMYAADDRCQRVVLAALARGMDAELPLAMRSFLYMPLMHAEDIACQERCVELFERIQQASDPALRSMARGQAKYAISHRDIVARFGRFPHRNEILGRESSAEELAFLEQPGSTF